jgi:predicted nucleic acid-binding protein
MRNGCKDVVSVMMAKNISHDLLLTSFRARRTSSSMGPSINGSLGLLSTLCFLSNLNALDNFPPGVEGNFILDPKDFSLSIVSR